MSRARALRVGGLLLAVVAATACGGEPAEPETLSASEPVRPRAALQAGDVHRYAFAWTVSSEGEAAMVGGKTITGDVELRGELAVEVYGQDEGAVVLGVSFAQLDDAVLAIAGQNVLPSSELLLDHQAVLVVPPDGAPRQLRVDPEAPPVFRTLIEGVLAHVDLSIPRAGAPSTTRVGPTGNGLARMRYRQSETQRDVIERDIVAYERIDALRGGPADPRWDVDGQARIELGDDALLEAIEVSEILTLAHAEEPLAFGSQTSFSMRRDAVEHGPPEPREAWPDFAAWPARDPFDPPDLTEADRVLARSFAEGLTATELIVNVQSAGRGVRPPKGFLVRARGLLRGWPEMSRELVYVFDNSPDPTTRALALDLLVSADTPEAQEVIVELLMQVEEADDPQLVGYLQHLSLLRNPTVPLANLLIDVHEAAVARGDDRLRAGSLYPMGAIASALLHRDPPLAQRMIDTIRGELARASDEQLIEAGIAGLGNLGLVQDAPSILAHRDHGIASVRIQVASSLRRMDTEAGTDALYEMLLDDERDVAAMSLSVIDGYRDSEPEIDRLATTVLDGAVRPDLEGPLVSVLAKHGLERDLPIQALLALRDRSRDIKTRTRIARILDLEPEAPG